MVKIHQLKQPNKRSGHQLAPGKTTEVKGMLITNKNKFVVHVDKFTRKPWKPAKKAAKSVFVKGGSKEIKAALKMLKAKPSVKKATAKKSGIKATLKLAPMKKAK